MNRLWVALFCLLGATTPDHAAEPEPTLFRWPTVSRTQVVFSYADDLWIASREGGEAKRLTSMAGDETYPLFSPDGTLVAFTSQTRSGQDVYVVPAAGGSPRRLTYHPSSDETSGWTPDGKSVVFSSYRNDNVSRLFRVPFEGGPAAELPLPAAADGTFSPDGKRMAYVPTESQHWGWTQYRGGATARIWIADLPDCRLEKIPRDNSNDFNPMWVDNRIYFLSDREGPVGLFAYDVTAKQVSEVVHGDGSGILSASASPDAIVYARFGSLHLYDLATGTSRRLDIRVSGDMPERKPRSVKVSENLAAVALSPAGDHVAIEARGEVLAVPVRNGRARNLTETPGVRERFPAWSPDGKRIAYFSDESGEYALHVRNSDGSGTVRKIDPGQPPGFYFSPVWSPDSKKIAYRDHRLALWYVEVESGTSIRIDADAYQERGWTRIEAPPPAWSPDSQWLGYTKMLGNHMRVLEIYSLETGRSRQVTDGFVDICSPQFDRSGQYLYFAASTDIGPAQGDDVSTWDLTPTRNVYVAVLREGLRYPTTPEGYSIASRRAEAGRVAIDFDRLADRVVALPIPARDYAKLVAGKPGVVFLVETVAEPRSNFPGMIPSSNRQNLYRFDLATKKTDKVIEGIRGFELSHDGEQMLFKQGSNWEVSKAAGLPKPGKGKLKLESLEVRVDPVAQWRQMYREVWRTERDFFYDPGFHGLDLKAREQEFEIYLESVASAADLNFLFEAMLSELRVSHSFASAGRGLATETPSAGLLGADYETADGRYRFRRIYAGDRWNPENQAPLVQPGLDVKQGDYLLAVGGRELRASDNVYQFFEGKAGKPVVLRIGSDAAGGQTRTVTVTPVEEEYYLRQVAWVEGNRRNVDALTGGRVAYIYLGDTGREGLAAFNRYYFAQADKEAVIIDERGNGGGALPDYFIDRLRQQVLALITTRYGLDFTSPYSVIRGPKVMITDEQAFSGGDAFAYYFKRSGLGPLVGTRTAGGLAGPVMLTLMDGGWVAAVSNAVYGPDGQWAVENEGVAPDIEVEQDPQAVRAGHDPQLEKAVEVIMDLLKKNPPPAIKRPPSKKLR